MGGPWLVRGCSFQNTAGNFQTRCAMAVNGVNSGGMGLFAGGVSGIWPEISELDAQWPATEPIRVGRACLRVQFPEYGRKFPNSMRNGRKRGQSGWNGLVRGWSFRNTAVNFHDRGETSGDKTLDRNLDGKLSSAEIFIPSVNVEDDVV